MVVLIARHANNGGHRCGCVCTPTELVSLMLVASGNGGDMLVASGWSLVVATDACCN